MLWVTERNGRAGAYVFARGTAMAEYGGPAALVVPMIARLLAEWDDPSVKDVHADARRTPRRAAPDGACRADGAGQAG